MTQPIDTAYVEIVARTAKAEKEIKQFVDREVKDLRNEFDKTAKQIDKDLDDTAKHAERSFKDLTNSAKKAASDVGEFFEATFNTVRLSVTRTTRRARTSIVGFFDSMDNRLNRFADRFPRVERGFNAVIDNVGKAFQSLGGVVTSVTQSFSLMGVAIGALIFAIPGLIGLVVSLGAALSTLSAFLLAIPAGLSVIAAAIAPVIVGFNNFGEALGAIIEGDPEKIAEAFKKLVPSARLVAKEFQAILPRLSALQKSVASALFGPLVGDLTHLANVLLGPLTLGMTKVAGIIGEMISGFAELASSKLGVETLNAVFQTTADLLATLRDSGLGTTLFTLIKATLPVVNQLMQRFIGFLTALGDKLKTSIDDGSFQEWLDSAFNTLDSLLGLGGAIFDFFGALFNPTTIGAGNKFLDDLTLLFTTLTQFLQTQEGQQFLEDLATDAQFLGEVLVGLTFVVAIVIRVFSGMMAVFLDFIGVADRTIVKAKEVKDTIIVVADDVVRVVENVPAQLAALGGKFADAGLFLIRSFIGGFRQAGGFITDVAGDIVSNVKGGLNKLIASINSGIASLDAILPFSLSRIPSLAAGGVAKATPGGQIVQVAEAGQDEAIVPLDDFFKKFPPGEGMTVNFGPDSINISFSGVVPTPAEARATGEAVGEGIATALARRDFRATARAL